MKIHDLEYFLFSRPIRRLKAGLIKSYQKGRLSDRKILRFLALIVLALSVFKTNLVDRPSPPVASSAFGTVLSAQLATPTPTPVPVPRRHPSSADLGPILAKEVLVVDASSSAVLYEKDSQAQWPPASTTKIMTALVAFGEYSLDEVLTVSPECVQVEGNSRMGLKAGEKITVRSLLYGLLIASAADSSCALSLGHGQRPLDFVAKMNEKAKVLEMTNTVYVNASGLDEANGGNLSTAADVLKLTQEALRNPTLKEITATVKTTVAAADESVSHLLTNTNELLTLLPGTRGVKTGFTEKAGGCLVFSYSHEGREILGVVLGSSERGRFEDVKKIIDWVFSVYVW